jgi:hypothetical protein
MGQGGMYDGYGSGKRPGPQRQDRSNDPELPCECRECHGALHPREVFLDTPGKFIARGEKGNRCPEARKRLARRKYLRRLETARERERAKVRPVVGGMDLGRLRAALRGR